MLRPFATLMQARMLRQSLVPHYVNLEPRPGADVLVREASAMTRVVEEFFGFSGGHLKILLHEVARRTPVRGVARSL